ncbi:MAG: trypsin-like serine protease [Verrucomicrobia bacterium]|nr:trypsin-like serine protease [Verrucomicrobiota bacterium]
MTVTWGADPERSVVQVFTFSQPPQWDSPWRFQSVQRGSGTGFLIKGKKIMTNAHVVAWARQILLKRYQDPRPYPAKVSFVGHDCDLAILEVEDERFFNGLYPLELGELPKVRSTVVTYGYPAGGEQISYTRGVVSRIELQNYVHIGNRSFLSVQTDAAINPGNSGGPVIQDDKVVGVAFMGAPGLENTGFFIPTQVVNHFLKDVEDGTYHGFPQAGIRFTPFQNPAYRRALKLPDDDRGARIDGLLPIPSTEELLKEEDVILNAGGFDVASDGTVLYQDNRVSMALAFQMGQHGESVPLRIWRDGKAMEVKLPVKVYDADKVTGNQYDVLPRYYVYGGLVFVPLSLDYLKTFGRNWSDSAAAELVYDLYYRKVESPKTTRQEPIVLASVLAHSVNANVKLQPRSMINRINGIRIEKLEDVIRAFASAESEFHVIEAIPNNTIDCLNRAEVEKANPDILRAYNITDDRRL